MSHTNQGETLNEFLKSSRRTELVLDTHSPSAASSSIRPRTPQRSLSTVIVRSYCFNLPSQVLRHPDPVLKILHRSGLRLRTLVITCETQMALLASGFVQVRVSSIAGVKKMILILIFSLPDEPSMARSLIQNLPWEGFTLSIPSHSSARLTFGVPSPHVDTASRVLTPPVSGAEWVSEAEGKVLAGRQRLTEELQYISVVFGESFFPCVFLCMCTLTCCCTCIAGSC